jgi:hypothetical protein
MQQTRSPILVSTTNTRRDDDWILIVFLFDLFFEFAICDGKDRD